MRDDLCRIQKLTGHPTATEDAVPRLSSKLREVRLCPPPARSRLRGRPRGRPGAARIGCAGLGCRGRRRTCHPCLEPLFLSVTPLHAPAGAILFYLAEKDPSHSLLPADAAGKAEALSWVCYQSQHLSPHTFVVVTGLMFGMPYSKEDMQASSEQQQLCCLCLYCNAVAATARCIERASKACWCQCPCRRRWRASALPSSTWMRGWLRPVGKEEQTSTAATCCVSLLYKQVTC